MGNWISGMKLIQDEGIDTYGNITCNADDTLVTDKLVDTDKGVHVTKEYFQCTLSIAIFPSNDHQNLFTIVTLRLITAFSIHNSHSLLRETKPRFS